MGSFLPNGFHIPLAKADTFVQQDNQTAGIFRTARGIHHTAALVQTILTGAKQPGVTDRRGIGEQGTGIGQIAIGVPDLKGIKQLFCHTAPGPGFILFPEHGEHIVFEVVFRISAFLKKRMRVRDIFVSIYAWFSCFPQNCVII